MHWQAPTLAFPTGFEVAWGSDCSVASPFGLFFSVLDPAAFLAYDAANDARLPGASIKTALAPGLAFRFGLKGSPFSVMPHVVYRPGFRQWDPALGGTGADALQVGLLLGVDVTLFELHRSTRGESAIVGLQLPPNAGSVVVDIPRGSPRASRSTQTCP